MLANGNEARTASLLFAPKRRTAFMKAILRWLSYDCCAALPLVRVIFVLPWMAAWGGAHWEETRFLLFFCIFAAGSLREHFQSDR